MSAEAEFRVQDLLSLFHFEDQSKSEGIEDFLGQLLARSAEWFRADGASLFSERLPGTFVLSAQHGPLAKIPDGATIRSGKGLAGSAISKGLPIIVQGESDESDQTLIGSSMIVPLIDSRHKKLGVLNLARSSSAQKFDDTDLELAASLGQHIALALSNAKLFSETKFLGDTLKVVIGSLGFALISLDSNGLINHFNPEVVMLLGKVPGSNESFTEYLFRCPNAAKDTLVQAAEFGLEGRRYRKRVTVEGRIWNMSATPLSSKGCTIAIQDVTDLEHAQREHDRLKRLAEVGQMTATIAHEIRNPLTGIRSAAQMLKDAPELCEEFSEIIEVECVKLAKLCDEFLEFARPLKLETAPATLTEIVNLIHLTLKNEFVQAGISLSLEITPNEPTIQLDTRRMEQVIRNLVLNSLQATPRGGAVILGVKARHFWIEDSGIGMEIDQVSKLFSPFFTTKPKGTGLGLSMSRKIIDAHDAKIEVQSKPGVGTRFDIRFEGE